MADRGHGDLMRDPTLAPDLRFSERQLITNLRKLTSKDAGAIFNLVQNLRPEEDDDGDA